MECYRDMTFCQFYADCKSGKNCFRALTPLIVDNAKAWDLPICKFTDKPDCFKQIKKST